MMLSDATEIAQAFERTLAPHCISGKLMIVGSVRRRKAEVHDIELLLIPLDEPEMRTELFGPVPTGKVVHCKGFRDVCAHPHVKLLVGDPAKGKLIRLWYQPPGKAGVQVELYIPTVQNWGYIQWIRTGPKEYTRRGMARLKQREFVPADGMITKYRQPVDCTTEEAIFAHLGWAYKEPQLRT